MVDNKVVSVYEKGKTIEKNLPYLCLHEYNYTLIIDIIPGQTDRCKPTPYIPTIVQSRKIKVFFMF